MHDLLLEVYAVLIDMLSHQNSSAGFMELICFI